MTPITAVDRDTTLLDRLRSRPAGPAIVYVTLQRTAEEVAVRLAEAGFPARPYHVGMEDDERAAVQEGFAVSERAIVVATIAFGMGIDEANIRYVYHYNLPKSLENLSQEIGRTGRDGLPSTCETFVCPGDLNALENFAYGDTPGAESVRGFVRDVFALSEEFDVSLYDVSAAHDIRQLVVRTLLTYLELDGHLEEGTPFFSRYQFRPLARSPSNFARISAGVGASSLEDCCRTRRRPGLGFTSTWIAPSRRPGRHALASCGRSRPSAPQTRAFVPLHHPPGLG